MVQNRFVVVFTFLAALLFSLFTPLDLQAGKEEIEKRLEALKVELQSLAPGEPRVEMLRGVLESDKKHKLGPWPVEAIIYEFLSMEKPDSALSYVKPLKKSKSEDYELKLILARLMFDRSPDQKGTFQLMREAQDDLVATRSTPPEDTYKDYWNFETRFMLADIDHEIATLYYEKGDLEGARGHIMSALKNRTRAKDLMFFGKLHMDVGNYRNALGAFGYALYLEDLIRADELFRTAYDSMQWEAKLYEPYKDKFLQEYHDQLMYRINNQRRGPKLEDLNSFTISNWIGPRGGALVVWGDYVEVEFWPELDALANTFQQQGVPYRFVYLGENAEENREEAKKRGYGFTGLVEATPEMLEAYKISIDPTVIIMDSEQRELMRVEGQNRDARDLFVEFWSARDVTP